MPNGVRCKAYAHADVSLFPMFNNEGCPLIYDANNFLPLGERSTETHGKRRRAATATRIVSSTGNIV